MEMIVAEVMSVSLLFIMTSTLEGIGDCLFPCGVSVSSSAFKKRSMEINRFIVQAFSSKLVFYGNCIYLSCENIVYAK